MPDEQFEQLPTWNEVVKASCQNYKWNKILAFIIGASNIYQYRKIVLCLH